MKKGKLIIYWVATGLLSFGMLGSGLAQISQAKEMVDIVVPLGYPLYFLYIIGVWKILGVIAILIPRFKLVKEWAYAGLFFDLTGATYSVIAHNGFQLPVLIMLLPLGFLFISYNLHHKMMQSQAQAT